MRHMPFAIGQAERDAWVKHMTAAIDAENFHPELRALFLDYFERTATFMMNR
jgi:hemoglobin